MCNIEHHKPSVDCLLACLLACSLSLSLTGTYKPSSFDVYRILKELFGTIAEMIELYSALCVYEQQDLLSLSLHYIHSSSVYYYQDTT